MYSPGVEAGANLFLVDLSTKSQRKIADLAYRFLWSVDGESIFYYNGEVIFSCNNQGYDCKKIISGQIMDFQLVDDELFFTTRDIDEPWKIIPWESNIQGENIKQIGPKDGLVANSIWFLADGQALVDGASDISQVSW